MPSNEAPPTIYSSDRGSGTGAPSRWWRQERWRWAFGCFLLGFAYTALAMYFGFELRIAGHDVSMVAGGLLEMSFAVLGYLLGLTTEARRGERAAARDKEDRLQQVADLQARLAHREKLASLGQLAGAVAHEVRNPLGIIRTMVQNLREELPQEAQEAEQACFDILEEVDRLARVTSQLVDFARPLKIQPAEVTMTDLTSRVRLLADTWLGDRRLSLLVEGPDRVRLRADADLLCQALLGLVTNAAEASPADGRIDLSWSQLPDGGVDIRVSDQGDGVPEELRAQIFEPFFTTRAEGHGLGLAVARQIVAAHGGTISVEECEPHGACFRIQLPAQWADAA